MNGVAIERLYARLVGEVAFDVKFGEGYILEDCRWTPCYDCGVCDHKVVHNVVYPKDEPGTKPKHRVKKAYIARSIDDLVRLPRGKAVPPPAPAPAPTPSEAGDGVEGSLTDQPLPIDGVRAAEAALAGEGAPMELPLDSALPESERIRIRLRFAKRGAQALSSHLELTQAFSRALRRADVPIIFTKGMHPRMRAQMSACGLT